MATHHDPDQAREAPPPIGRPESIVLSTKGLSVWYGSVDRPAGHHDRHPPEPDHRPDRPVGLRQEHAAPLLQPDERPDPGSPDGRADHLRRPGSRRARGRRRRPPSTDRDGLPEAEPVPEKRSTRTSPGAPGSTDTKGTWTTWSRNRSAAPRSGTRSSRSSTARAWNSPAASSSGFASPGPWRSSPR